MRLGTVYRWVRTSSLAVIEFRRPLSVFAVKVELAAEEVTITESTIWKVLQRHNLSGSAIEDM